MSSVTTTKCHRMYLHEVDSIEGRDAILPLILRPTSHVAHRAKPSVAGAADVVKVKVTSVRSPDQVRFRRIGALRKMHSSGWRMLQKAALNQGCPRPTMA